MNSKLLEIKNLSIYFKTFFGLAKAVRNLDLYINKGEILGLVGESGCGKSITARSILGLLKTPPAILPNGEIIYKNERIFPAAKGLLRKIRGKEISMIFQEPMTSLNPVMKIGKQLEEVFVFHYGKKGNYKDQIISLFKKVGIPDAEKRYNIYPHQLSGGLRQRVMIAMALAFNPGLLIADEPTTALDVTIQAQILDLIQDLKEKSDMSVLMITHDLGVISEIADRINVMYAGKIVEISSVDVLLDNPKHPYSEGLINSIPDIELEHKKGARLNTLKGTVPELYSVPAGCPFSNRCPRVMNICTEKEPFLKTMPDGNQVACWLYE